MKLEEPKKGDFPSFPSPPLVWGLGVWLARSQATHSLVSLCMPRRP